MGNKMYNIPQYRIVGILAGGIGLGGKFGILAVFRESAKILFDLWHNVD